tara:strand:+ start:1021 stop:1755 length:735 start_codon:yes stop_codon:yes gene_type:complete
MGHYNIIKLNATSSTNDKVKMLLRSKKIHSGDIVWTDYQYKGRGQYKNKWNSSKGKNLLISLYREFKGLKSKQVSYLNFVISLSIIKTIEYYISSDNYIKWPNDIMSGQKKISGILIENSIKAGELNNSIIGIGINVNQTRFRNIVNATSIKLITNTEIRVEEVLDKLIKNTGIYLKVLMDQDFHKIIDLYNSKLYGKDYCKFLINNETFEGKVINVNPSGSVNVKINGFGIKEYESNGIKILL